MEKLFFGPQYEKKTQEIISGGKESFHILADFDKTLTYARVEGKETPSIISVLYNEGYLSEEYSQKAQALADKYRPIESDYSVSLEIRKEKMLEWRTLHRQLLLASKLSLDHIKKVVDSGIIQLRSGYQKFFQILYEKKIPLIIMSASGLGTDAITQCLQKNHCFYNNVFVISNGFTWNQDGYAVAYNEPIIHSLNKDETVISKENFPQIYQIIEQRKNVMLLGDGMGDLGMVDGFDHNVVLKVGFLNDNKPEKRQAFENAFDLIIENDGGMEFLSEFVEKI